MIGTFFQTGEREMGSLGQMGMRIGCLKFLCLACGLSLQPMTAFSQEPAQVAEAAEMQYPISLAIAPDGSLVVVDLDLPGVWRLPAAGGVPELIVRGATRFRQPLNRPRCVAVQPDGRIFIGDTATREIYVLAADGSGDPQPLTAGFLGVPNSLALDAEGNLFIADLESRFVYRVAASGGQPELYAKTNARGLHIGPSGQLWAVTPTATPLVKLKADQPPEVVVGERKFEFPHNVVVLPDGSALVSDGYAKTIWRVDPSGAVESWLAGEPLQNPVGLALHEGQLFIADPHAKQIFRVSLESKQVEPLVQAK
ncbi:hypothetical protein SH139x_004312 [Planctomycetaceae bacterium SH139]